MSEMKIFLISNTAWSLVNFRSGLMRELLAAGHEVVAVAPPDESVERIESLGIGYMPLSMDNKGTHPGKDLLLLWRIYALLRDERPDLVISYTIKPVIYASLAARWLQISVINVVTGLGTAFMREGLLSMLVGTLYQFSQRRVQKLFFLNRDDLHFFNERRLAPADRIEMLPSEGIDLSHFTLSSKLNSADDKAFRFLLIARMIWDKGIGEYVEAARRIRNQNVDAVFYLLGFLDVQNATAISRQQMDEWVAEGVVQYVGVTDDVRDHIAAADCIVLPSYREGVPRTLLEAAAMGRPIITTNAVGCREVVDDGANGWLCMPRDAEDLAQKMRWMMALAPEERAAMGRLGRDKVEREFDEKVVISRYWNAIESISERKKA